MKRNILITGGAGFIGAHLARRLVEAGNTVVVMDDESGGDMRNVEAFIHPTRCVDCTCSDRHEVAYRLRRHSIDTVIHCAANAREGASQFQPHAVTQRNMEACSATLSASISHGVEAFILFSSMSVYGGQAPPFSEAMPRTPVDVYGINKAAMEHMVEVLASVHGFSYSIVRPHNVFGELQALHDIHRNVVAIFMNRIMRDEPLFIYGDGQQQRAFSYIADSLPTFARVVEGTAHEFNGETFNIGGTEVITVSRLREAVLDAMGAPADYPTHYLPDRPCEVKNAFATFEKSVKRLDYKESAGWLRGVHQMAAWAKAQGPHQWRNTDKLEIISDKTPRPWVEEAAKEA